MKNGATKSLDLKSAATPAGDCERPKGVPLKLIYKLIYTDVGLAVMHPNGIVIDLYKDGIEMSVPKSLQLVECRAGSPDLREYLIDWTNSTSKDLKD